MKQPETETKIAPWTTIEPHDGGPGSKATMQERLAALASLLPEFEAPRFRVRTMDNGTGSLSLVRLFRAGG